MVSSKSMEVGVSVIHYFRRIINPILVIRARSLASQIVDKQRNQSSDDGILRVEAQLQAFIEESGRG